MKISHQYYDIPGITDRAVMQKNCEDNRDRKNEISVLHSHTFFKTEHGKPVGLKCTEACTIYIPGKPPVSVLAVGD